MKNLERFVTTLFSYEQSELENKKYSCSTKCERYTDPVRVEILTSKIDKTF